MRAIFFLPFLMALAACAANPGGEVNDPFESVNRQVHAFNVGLDRHVVRPVTRLAKRDRTPDAADRAGPVTLVSNFGSNLSLPGKVLNHVLQGRPDPAVQNTARFLINSTLGLAGLLDPAGLRWSVPEIDTDFGETMHVWGVPEGAYVELPVLGPSTQRDAFGKVVDLVIDPMRQVLGRDTYRIGLAARIVSKAGERARFGSTVDQVLHDSADSYAQTRLLYLQHRRFELKQEQEVIDPYAE